MSVLIQKDVCRLGIYICGTGIGFTCQANKHWEFEQQLLQILILQKEQD